MGEVRLAYLLHVPGRVRPVQPEHERVQEQTQDEVALAEDDRQSADLETSRPEQTAASRYEVVQVPGRIVL